MPTHFLYLTNARLVGLVERRGRLAERREFEVTNEGLVAFERYVETRASLPTRLITDLSEEDFRPDTIPHVSARDREAIVTRRLGQIYRGTPFRHAVVQGREGEGRRDDRVLYTSITNVDVLQPWLEVLQRFKVPLEGIHSAALIGARLLRAIEPGLPHALLVLFMPGGALRQTYFRGGELHLTRLTHVDEGVAVGPLLAEETTRTWQYLDNLRTFAPDDRLQVRIVGQAADRPAIEPALRDFPQLEYRYVDIEQVAAKVGLKSPPASSTAEEILVQLFLRRPVENHFASPELRRFATFRKTRRVINQASIIALGASLIVGTWNLTHIIIAGENVKRISQEVQSLNQEFERINRSLPAVGIGGGAMRDAVAFYTGHLQHFPSMSAFLVPLSGVLEQHPQVRLRQLAWQVADRPDAMPAVTVSPPRTQPPVKAFSRSSEGARRTAAEDVANPPFAGGRFEVAMIEATVSVQSHDFRGALRDVERLAEQVARLPGYRAEVLESPLDLRSSLQLQGRHGDREPERMEPRFMLRIVRDRSVA